MGDPPTDPENGNLQRFFGTARRQGDAWPLIAYVYGGSFAFSAGPSHARLAQRVADEARAEVVLVTYALSPEQPFPLGVEGVARTLGQLTQEAAMRPIFLLCDTAGASVALGALHLALRRGDKLPLGLIVLLPWVDLTLSGGSFVSNIRDSGATSDVEILATLLGDYLQGADPRDPLASPVWGDLSQFPPMQIHGDLNDILLDDARLLHARAKEAGVASDLYLWDKVPDTLQRDETFPQQMEAIFALIGTFVRGSGSGAQKVSASKETLQADYVSLMQDFVQPHMQPRIDAMFDWAKSQGPDWVWSFIEKRIAHGAVATQDQIEQDWLRGLFDDADVATLLLTSSRYIVLANAKALGLLGGLSGLARSNGRLVGVGSENEIALAGFLESFAGPESEPAYLVLRGPDDRATLVSAERMSLGSLDGPAPPVTLVCFQAQDDTGGRIAAKALMNWFGLSAREAELAVAFYRGEGLAEYAQRVGVSMATVRTQFAQVKSKMNARDQAALVRKLAHVATLM